jgi:hypothetical protein
MTPTPDDARGSGRREGSGGSVSSREWFVCVLQRGIPGCGQPRVGAVGHPFTALGGMELLRQFGAGVSAPSDSGQPTTPSSLHSDDLVSNSDKTGQIHGPPPTANRRRPARRLRCTRSFRVDSQGRPRQAACGLGGTRLADDIWPAARGLRAAPAPVRGRRPRRSVTRARLCHLLAQPRLPAGLVDDPDAAARVSAAVL